MLLYHLNFFMECWKFFLKSCLYYYYLYVKNVPPRNFHLLKSESFLWSKRIYLKICQFISKWDNFGTSQIGKSEFLWLSSYIVRRRRKWVNWSIIFYKKKKSKEDFYGLTCNNDLLWGQNGVVNKRLFSSTLDSIW